MKILFVITELYEGGAENALRHVVLNLNKQNHKVMVVCFFGGNGDSARDLIENGIDVRCINIQFFLQLRHLMKLKKMIVDEQPDIVHSWLFHANFFVRFFVPESIPLICSLRVVEPRKSHILLDRWTKNRVDQYVCVSDNVMNFALDTLHASKKKCQVINNGVDFKFFAAARNQDREFNKIIGLTIGRLTHQKGLDILLSSLALLPNDLDWQWKIIGDEPEPAYARYLKQLAKKLNIDKKIIWRGFVKKRDIIHHFVKSNLFILSSRWEGQPNVVLEALASGIPVIASKTSGIDELLNMNVGCLQCVSEETPEAWSRAIIDYWSNKSKIQLYIENGIKLSQSLTWDRVTQKHLEVYKILTKSICPQIVTDCHE